MKNTLGVAAPDSGTTYRQTFDHLGRPRPTSRPSLKRVHLQHLARWLGVAAAIVAWAALTGWMDGAQ